MSLKCNERTTGIPYSDQVLNHFLDSKLATKIMKSKTRNGVSLSGFYREVISFSLFRTKDQEEKERHQTEAQTETQAETPDCGREEESKEYLTRGAL